MLEGIGVNEGVGDGKGVSGVSSIRLMWVPSACTVCFANVEGFFCEIFEIKVVYNCS